CGPPACLRAPASLSGKAETGTDDGHLDDRRGLKTFGQKCGQWEVLDRFQGVERRPFVNALNELYARYSLDELQFVGEYHRRMRDIVSDEIEKLNGTKNNTKQLIGFE